MRKSELLDQLLVLIEEFGKKGSFLHANGYATAWLARIPDIQNMKKPAFPQAISWLKANQLDNGAWGTTKPTNPFANTLSTLIAILALQQWDTKGADSIVRAQQALTDLTKVLDDQGNKTFGFELILATLLEEFQTKQLFLPADFLDRCESYRTSGEQQRTMLQGLLQQTDYRSPNIFWLCLEMLGSNFMLDKQKPLPISPVVLANNGSVLASVSATAYLLAASRYRGQDLPSAFIYLKKLVEENNGGVPPFHPMEQYELAFALDFLLKGGVSIRQITVAVDKLQQYWQQRNGLGYSQYSPSLDADDTAIGLIILKKSGKQVDYKSLLQFFNGNYFSHYVEDSTPSVSVNANVLRALSFFQDVPEIQAISKKVLHWMKEVIDKDLTTAFQDSWHISPYYAASAIIFALKDYAPDYAERCVDWVLSQQLQDGGWGFEGNSTEEETALTILALANQQTLYHKISPETLIRAKNFLNVRKNFLADHSLPALYKGTTMVCPIKVVESTIFAAKYVLEQLDL